MELLKQSRTQHRRLFTQSCNEFEKSEVNLNNEQKLLKLKIIVEKGKLLLLAEEKVRDELFREVRDESEVNKEIDESETYLDKFRVFEFKLEEFISLSERENMRDNMSVCGSVGQSNSLLHYPKIKLPMFDGNLKNWLSFWGQFKKIGSDIHLDDHDKFSYLSQAMQKGSCADELVSSFPPGGESYSKALRQLQSRYGKEELLIQLYVRDLLSIVLQQQKLGKCSLRKLYDQLEAKLRALEVLGVTREKYAAMLFPLVESCMPDETLKAWERYRAVLRRSNNPVVIEAERVEVVTKTDLDSLLEFLEGEVEAEERVDIASQSFVQSTAKTEKRAFVNVKQQNMKPKFGKSSHAPSTSELFVTPQEKRVCLFCDSQHNPWQCDQARNWTVEERVTAVAKSQCCFLCLNPGHLVRKCKMKSCYMCGKRHNVLLCRGERASNVSQSSESKTTESVVGDSVLTSQSPRSEVLLQTIVVRIKNESREVLVRAIIDSGSERTYISKDIIQMLKFENCGEIKLIHKLFGGVSSGEKLHFQYKVTLTSIDDKFSCKVICLDQPVICDNVKRIPNGPWVNELKEYGIHVSDTQYSSPKVGNEIKLLLGADVAGKLLTGNIKLLTEGPVVVETHLGWTLMGKIPVKDSSVDSHSSLSLLTTDVPISHLWSLDVLGIMDPYTKRTQVELQEAAREHFLKTVRVGDDSRFEVNMPWLEGHAQLPTNYDLAYKRLNSTVKRLKSQSIYERYKQVFSEWLEEGVIEEVKDDCEENVHYLPHRPVVKENSTTKIRPVFDASAKIKGFPSLNDCLEKGENLIELIPSILMRFRAEEIGVIADIRKAFLQIKLTTTDRNYLRFLWLSDEGIEVYRHCRVVFGVTCSPFLLSSTIRYLLTGVLKEIQEHKSLYPETVVQKLMKSFYVDNCVTSVKDTEELELFRRISTEIMASRKFDLRGWEQTDLTADRSEPTNVLGMIWDKQTDTLQVNTVCVKGLEMAKVTKRTILSAAHRLFDPLGIISPVTLIPKLILQSIWKMKLGWDDEVDRDTRREFLKWIEGVLHIEKISIPRFFGLNGVNNCSMHFFCDASKLAYAVVAYIRVETESGVQVQLIQARSRVAPTGKGEITIARLELLAATTASRLSTTISTEIACDEVYFWSDSTTVLAWIRINDPWGIFVYNRVREIRELTDTGSWRHVPGFMNPADLPSRGCSAQQLLKLKWWEGPNWLYLTREMWPSSENIVNEEEVNCERKKGITTSMMNFEIASLLGSHNSDYKRIVHTVAWMKRFLHNCQNQTKWKDSLSVNELLEAEKTIVYLIQKESFTGVSDKRLKSLDIFFDEKGIIKLKTTVYRREDYEEFRTPAILPGEHPIVKSLVLAEHKEKGHAGVNYTLNSLRERFWLLCGRRTVKSVLRSCVVCKRFSAKPVNPPTAKPPADRVQDANIFQVTGVDFAGPVILKDNSKAWICLFTCAVYRATHLELVTSLSTETFLLCFHRFVARRGKPSIVYSDNGTNFTGAAKALSCIDFKEVCDKTRDERIHWKFIPPSAPWWGGFYERLVGMMKDILKKTLSRASLTYEEMQTALCNCEAILNERPLTTVSSNSTLTSLRPADFLKEIKNSFVSDIMTQPDPNYLRRRIRYLQTVREAFRVRFRQEYLGALCTRQNKNSFQPLREGDIVLIGDDNKKRVLWPLGRVIESLPGVDGVVRRVKLKTQQGELYRAAQRLYHLEVSSNENWSDTEHVKNDVRQNKTVQLETVGNVPATTRSGRTVKIPNKLTL